MIYAIAFSSFMFGFSLAIALITRASIRPKARKILKQAKLIRPYPAYVPKPKQNLAEDDYPID
jgi:hypothetical protein